MDRFCWTTPLALGGDLNSSGPDGDPYTNPSVVSGLWASGSDNGESWPAEAKGSESGSECADASGSAHQVGSAGVDSMTDVESG